MQTKHFFTDPSHLVNTALQSATLTNPSLALDRQNKIVYRRPQTNGDSKKVSIISGGGSGHEPAFAGFVGKGMLTAAVAGTIFASPSAEQVRTAVMERIETSKGVLIMTLNYTGDVLNFGMAAEKANAAGIKTAFCTMADDVGVGRTKGGKVGRRGIAGSLLSLKVVGALAEMGASLEDVYQVGKLAVENVVTVGASLEHVHVPGREIPDVGSEEGKMPQGEIEIGMGIHNEPGSHRVKATLPELVTAMLTQLLDQNDKDRAFLNYDPSDQFVLFVNNLGGLSTLELSGITFEIASQLLRDHQIKPVRTIQGTFLTSLNGMGFSISLLKLADTGLGPGKSLLELLDAPAECVGWAAPIQSSTWNNDSYGTFDAKAAAPVEDSTSNFRVNPSTFKKVLAAGLNRMVAAEPSVTRYDTIVGDGDCGIGLKRGAEAVLRLLNADDVKSGVTDDLLPSINRIVAVVENSMDGTSGAIYVIFLNALAHALREQDSPDHVTAVTVDDWAKALKYSLKALAKYTPAQQGDRTLIDALAPFINELGKSGDVKAAARAAQLGTEATKEMKASLGRSVYVGSEEEWIGKVPDPGAYGLSEFLSGMAEVI